MPFCFLGEPNGPECTVGVLYKRCVVLKYNLPELVLSLVGFWICGCMVWDELVAFYSVINSLFDVPSTMT